MNLLRQTLRELAVQADECQLPEMLDPQLTSPTDETNSTSGLLPGHTDTTSSITSDSSVLSEDFLTSTLSFLQAAFPHISPERLKHAMTQSELDAGEMDLWDVIISVLNEEAIKELEERGIERQHGDEDVLSTLIVDDIPWELVQRRRQRSVAESNRTTMKRTNHGRKITLVDIRQQQHAPVPRSVKRPAGYFDVLPSPDPWTTITSLSDQLSELIRSYPASYFQSYFHSPKFPTPYKALYSALSVICDTSAGQSAEDTAIISTLLDILHPDCDVTLDVEQRSRLYSDVQLAVKVTQGHSDDALDLVRILRDLDSDSASGSLRMGIYHSLPEEAKSLTSPSGRPQLQILKHVASLPSEPPPIPPPPSQGIGKPPSSPSGRSKAWQFQWQTVPSRKNSIHDTRSMDQHPPSYTRGVNGFRIKGSGNVAGKGGKGDVGELASYNRKIRESLRQRDQLLREAAKMWQKGAKARGGEVAYYLAERAREFQELAKREAFNAARAKVHAKRQSSQDKDTLDLHGTTVTEAVTIVKEELQQQHYSASKPLKIITGRGSHSVNQVSILKPAVKKALDEDGWSVGVWEGGLVVRGKRTTVSK
ncbi:hypothetical protein AMATHDRAFT_75206 [Amanita thiersii Skay4041]|uniref:Smr domain-containing protein n=1 Tax=Amanita thiersii Skay4041 TaxID=703135 RepID=A0A2A9NTH4_9AGAR|nr:hypothetical protein AMATHDRAFT_75206 [Amanita thiersii Skay4041]